MEEKLKYYEESKKKTYAEMLVLEDRSRQLKTKIGAYSGNQDDQEKIFKGGRSYVTAS